MVFILKFKNSCIRYRFLLSLSTFAFYIYLFSGCSSPFDSPENFRFTFNNKGKFKIVQFTDLHWGGASGVTKDVAPTVATIKSILEIEKPDFAVITGDISNMPDTLKRIAAIFEDAKTPFTIILGNHDGEEKYSITGEGIFDCMMQSPYFVGDKGPEDISGTGNFIIPVNGNDSKIAALLYFFDSNSYSTNPEIRKSAVIHFNQIQWYREQSDKHIILNDGKPLPSLAFFHIPLPEYDHLNSKMFPSEVHQDLSAPVTYNTGAFASFVEKRDIMGIFVGHEHHLDHIGIERGIALGYGRLTGWNASAHGPDPYKERGARIIELNENKFEFDTWLRTADGIEQIFHYPTGAIDETSIVP